MKVVSMKVLRGAAAGHRPFTSMAAKLQGLHKPVGDHDGSFRTGARAQTGPTATPTSLKYLRTSERLSGGVVGYLTTPTYVPFMSWVPLAGEVEAPAPAFKVSFYLVPSGRAYSNLCVAGSADGNLVVSQHHATGVPTIVT